MRGRDWRGDLSLFHGLRCTQPTAERVGLSWGESVEVVAPARGARLVADKARVLYVLPCLLRSAEFVGKTREHAIARGLSIIGKQRSSSHVTSATWLLFDLDGVGIAEFAEAYERLINAGVAFLAFTSYSHGAPGKPGVRARVMLPVDAALDAAGYRQAWQGGNALYLDGRGDVSSSLLWQAQGVWATHPDRAHLARRWGNFDPAARVQSVGELMAHAPKDGPTRSGPTVEPRPADSVQMAQALGIVATVPDGWLLGWAQAPARVCDGEGREREVLRLAGRLRAAGVPEERIEDATCLFNRTALVPPLDESVVVDRVRRYEADTRVDAAVFALARDWSMAVCVRAARSGDWAGCRPVWTYLARYHPGAWSKVESLMKGSNDAERG